MIDTDKYEGHTSDWKWIYIDGDYHGVNVDNDFYLYSLQSVFGNKIIYDTPDGKLAQDAPLLLAEYKRLRNIILKFDDAIYHGNFHINQLLGIWYNLLTKEEEE